MNLRYLTVYLSLLIATFLNCGFSQNIPDALNEKLESQQVLLEYQDSFEALRLLPNNALALGVEASLLERATTVEVLTRIPLETELQGEALDLALFNLLQSVRSMQGIEYYSVSFGRMRELFTKSYVVAGRDDKRALEDSYFEVLPEVFELYMLQEDTSFGENIYKASYQTAANGILLEIRNETRLRFNLIPIFNPQELLTTLLILVEEDSILFYGVVNARVPNIPFVKTRFQESLINRLIALRGWFEQGLSTF